MVSKRTKFSDQQVTRVLQDCPEVFSLADMRKALTDSGVIDEPGSSVDHVADRLVRRLKDDGRIHLTGRVWTKAPQAHPVLMVDQRP